MDDFEQLGVTSVAEYPPASRPARNLVQLAALVAAALVLTAVAIFACVAVAAGAAALLGAGIQ